jgi:predicted AlkP superfamily pyrophosphatase or phosphodiesterase
MFQVTIIIAIDGLGRFINQSCSNINNLSKNGTIYNVNSVIPSDSAQNWGSILTGVRPDKHKLKLENLDIPYNNEEYPSLFKIILKSNKIYKTAAFVSWEPIITGMIEPELTIDRYAPLLNENFISKYWMYFNHYILKKPIYDSYLVQNVINYIYNINDLKFLFIHLVDLDEVGHMYDFNSNEYKKKLKETDNYIGTITESIFEKYENPLILLTTDHGGIENKHGGNSEDEINTFIASNVNLDSLNIEDINYNMNCSKIILKALNINFPSYFD